MLYFTYKYVYLNYTYDELFELIDLNVTSYLVGDEGLTKNCSQFGTFLLEVTWAPTKKTQMLENLYPDYLH